MSVLTTHNLSVGYRQKHGSVAVLTGLDLQLRAGSLVALLGANGAGKSTLLRTLTAIQPPLVGDVAVAGKNIYDMTSRERSRQISIVTTDRVMAGALSVYELVSLGRQPHTGFLGHLSADDRMAVTNAIECAGIASKSQSLVSQLSDGERQKAMIAKALAQSTPLIVLDEPTSFLDVASRVETMCLLHRLAHEQGKAVLLSTHDVSQALLIADQLWVITVDGTLLAGDTETLITNGTMDNMFAEGVLSFDIQSCDYAVTLPTSWEVALTCADNRLDNCVRNALMRGGVAVSMAAAHHATVRALDDILYDGQQLISIKQLVATIKMEEDRR